MVMDYESDINIDEQALDVEWLNHPSRVVKYNKHAAQTRFDMDMAAEKIKVIKAQLDQQVRSDPPAFGIISGTRLTEAAVDSVVQTHPDYQEAVREHLSARYEYDVAMSVSKAFDHRKSALENLVRLHGQSYFAGPSVPHNLTEERSMRDRRAQQRIGMRRMRRD